MDKSFRMKTQTLSARAKSGISAVRKILVPSDFSPASDHAFKYALQLAQHFGAEVHVVHVLESVVSPEFAGRPEAPVFSTKKLMAAEKKLRVWANLAGASARAPQLIHRHGFAAHEIVEAAKDFDIDLVIISTLGHTGSEHFCIGSTAERVVRSAPCQVLVVRQKERASCSANVLEGTGERAGTKRNALALSFRNRELRP
jgi:universal stress protein A